MNLFRVQRKSSLIAQGQGILLLAYWTLLLTSPTGKWSFWGIPITDISQYSIMLNNIFFFGGGGEGGYFKKHTFFAPCSFNQIKFWAKEFLNGLFQQNNLVKVHLT